MTTGMILHHLPVEIGHGYSWQELQVASLDTTSIYNSWVIWQIWLNIKTEKLELRFSPYQKIFRNFMLNCIISTKKQYPHVYFNFKTILLFRNFFWIKHFSKTLHSVTCTSNL